MRHPSRREGDWDSSQREQTASRAKRKCRVKVQKVVGGLAKPDVANPRRIPGMEDDGCLERGANFGREWASGVERRVSYVYVGVPGKVGRALGKRHPYRCGFCCMCRPHPGCILIVTLLWAKK